MPLSALVSKRIIIITSKPLCTLRIKIPIIWKQVVTQTYNSAK